jgi:hypothetical protein
MTENQAKRVTRSESLSRTDNTDMAGTDKLTEILATLGRMEPTMNDMKDDLHHLKLDMAQTKAEQNRK